MLPGIIVADRFCAKNCEDVALPRLTVELSGCTETPVSCETGGSPAALNAIIWLLAEYTEAGEIAAVVQLGQRTAPWCMHVTCMVYAL
jgi:hypothetical protein